MTPRISRVMRTFLSVAFITASSLSASAQFDHLQASNCDLGCCDSDCCDSGCCDNRACGSLYGEIQYLNLSMFESEYATITDDTDASLGSDSGYRINLGYETQEGLGLRLRYFDFDGRTTFSDGVGGLNASYFDLEVTDRFCLGKMQGMLSAGYRHADWEQIYRDETYVKFEGDGVTLGAMLERDLGCNLDLFGWVQQSILFGKDTYDGYESYVMSWTEVQLGAQYNANISGCGAFLRGGFEAQRHEAVANADSQDMGLAGWFLSVGMDY